MKESNKFLITILIPVYSDKRIELALQSLRNQTLKNFKVIVFNDGGEDFIEIIDKFRDLNITYIKKRRNQGLSKSLNKCISKVNTKYIARLDADDYALPERFELQLDFLRSHNLDLIGTSVIKYVRNSERLFSVGKNINNKNIENISLNYSPLAHPTFFGKTKLFKKILYDEKLLYSQDYDFIVRCIINKYKIGNLNIPLLIYSSELNNNFNKIFYQVKVSNEISKNFCLHKKGLKKYKLNYKKIKKRITSYEKFCLFIRNKVLKISNHKIRNFCYLLYFIISYLSYDLRTFSYRHFIKIK